MRTVVASAFLAGSLLPFASSTPLLQRGSSQNVSSDATGTCKTLNTTLSSASQVFYDPDPEYANAVNHLSLVNVDNATCVVEPGNTKDVAAIIKLIAQDRVHFGIKGGGHCLNKDCSSTTGVLISMKRFNSSQINKDGTVEIGAGLIWDEIYDRLENTGVGVLGARVNGVGVAGTILGGGYSFRSNQYGLAIDRTVKYELITPQGQILEVTNSSYPDLFWGLKGGLNNLGIVTRFWQQGYPTQHLVWGGTRMYTADKLDALYTACVNFEKTVSNDDKAVGIVSYIWANGTESGAIVAFYDAPLPGAVYNEYDEIVPSVDDWKTRTLTNHVASYTSDNLVGLRVKYHNADVLSITPAVIDAVKNIRPKYIDEFQAHGGVRFSLSLEPSSDHLFKHSKGGLFPHDLKNKAHMIVITVVWTDPAQDDYFETLAQRWADDLNQAAIADGQDLSQSPAYPNLARGNATLQSMYLDNVSKMQQIVAKWDPAKVMNLAGGVRFQ